MQFSPIYQPKVSAVLLFWSLAMMSVVAQAGSLGLDGKVFDVEMLAAGSDEAVANTLTFHDGTFLSAVCVKHDFPQASYTATEAGGQIQFKVRAESYTKGYMTWEGSVENGQLQASALWHRPDRDEPVSFEVSGREKSAEQF